MVTVFRRQRLPACHPVLVPPLQEPGQNTETEFLLLPAMHKCYLPACVPVQWFFVTLWTVAPQAPMSMGFPRQEYWSGLPFPSPGDLPYPGIECISPALTDEFFTHCATREAQGWVFVFLALEDYN